MYKSKSVPTFESRSFAAKITGEPAHHRLTVLATPYYRTFLNTHFEIGDNVTLSITDKKPKRTDAQNRYYFLFLSEIAKETGNDPEALHELFKAKFLPNRIADVMGEQVEIRASTKRLSRVEFGEYIDHIAALTGIEPPPTDTIPGI